MLGEGHRRKARGADVAIGFVETHGRKNTADQIGDLEVIRRARLPYRGTYFEEMDLGAVLARRPEIALVDELAHSNVPGSRNEKRWQDVDELLDAGIDVISTVNIQHLESLNNVVEKITGVPQREKIPDAVVRAADQVELIDMTPRPCAAGWRTATSIRPRRSMPPSRTTSAPGTSRRCGNSRCSGWPTR